MARILIVDDEPDILSVLESILAGAGHEVVAASNGAEAMARLREQAVDLVISDINMPGVDGLDLLRAVREDGARIPIVLLTGDAKPETATRSLKYNVFDYLVKPPRRAQILDTVDRALQAAAEAAACSVDKPDPPSKKDALRAYLRRKDGKDSDDVPKLL
ncbi:MAG: response regulator [Kiritimatiellae bacterium]|nr:response regulator [Kiritimatiellia bacterium]